MINTKNIFLFLFICPLLFIIYVGILNINKSTKVNLLIWQSKEQSLGVLLILGGLAGFTISSSNILLNNYHPINNTRRVTKRVSDDYNSFTELIENEEEGFDDEYISDSGVDYIERDIREPIPTIAVPYRIINDKYKSKLNEESMEEDFPDNEEMYKQSIRNKTTDPDTNDWQLKDYEQW